jgi:hypothetical protein
LNLRPATEFHEHFQIVWDHRNGIITAAIVALPRIPACGAGEHARVFDGLEAPPFGGS